MSLSGLGGLRPPPRPHPSESPSTFVGVARYWDTHEKPTDLAGWVSWLVYLPLGWLPWRRRARGVSWCYETGEEASVLCSRLCHCWVRPVRRAAARSRCQSWCQYDGPHGGRCKPRTATQMCTSKEALEMRATLAALTRAGIPARVAVDTLMGMANAGFAAEEIERLLEVMRDSTLQEQSHPGETGTPTSTEENP